MCFGKDFENGRELVREIVDEKTEDIQTFLNCVDDHSQINGSAKEHNDSNMHGV